MCLFMGKTLNYILALGLVNIAGCNRNDRVVELSDILNEDAIIVKGLSLSLNSQRQTGEKLKSLAIIQLI